jgi:hypothetical protein
VEGAAVGDELRAYVSRNRFACSASLSLALMALQFAAISASPWGPLVRVVLPATIALVPVALWPLRRYVGVSVMFIGLAANLAVILANGGLMPIERSTVVEAAGAERAASYVPGSWIEGSKDVLVADGAGRATSLGDSIIVRVGGGGFAASPGDIVVWCGLALLVAEASWGWQRARRAPGRRETAPAAHAAEGSAPTPQ